VDLTLDSDDDRKGPDPDGSASSSGASLKQPPESAIKEVMAVLTHLDRKGAVELLQKNHHNAEDAIDSMFAQERD
jgi:hypothetical protein